MLRAFLMPVPTGIVSEFFQMAMLMGVPTGVRLVIAKNSRSGSDFRQGLGPDWLRFSGPRFGPDWRPDW